MCDKQGKGFGDGINLNQLLTELYAKRRWLDDVISGLEAVEHSPEVALVTAVEEILGSPRSLKAKVDLLGKRTRRLKPLLKRVKYGNRAGRHFEQTRSGAPV